MSTVDFQVAQYVFKRRADGEFPFFGTRSIDRLQACTNLINLEKTWEKLLFAAHAIAAVENPAEVCMVSARPYAQRALLKFAVHTGATPIVGRLVPGSFTNQIQKNFRGPHLIHHTSDQRVDHQAINEASPDLYFYRDPEEQKKEETAATGGRGKRDTFEHGRLEGGDFNPSCARHGGP
ncbi:40S ribosomal protein SA [Aphelenchoides fujianensis]|nr:40S ribosomal protein SA [Aphelenchoides fujianensis]